MLPPNTGVLLLNLGSPRSPEPSDVRDYLNEFLNDPYVIDIPWALRKILVNGIILNTRPKKTAEAYRSIWTAGGSPLLTHTRNLTQKLAKKMGTPVEFAMRYGTPSLKEVLPRFKNIDRIIFVPLYPQYSYAASESSIVEFQKQVRIPSNIIEDYCAFPPFIEALADSIRPTIDRVKPDRLLLSYHGIPERQIAKIKCPPTECLTQTCCDAWTEKNQKCYRAQCYETSRQLGAKLNWPQEKIVVAFQSRLGRTKWIEPYTDQLLATFPKQGVKKLVVASPSFSADCLETLEEIQIRYQELFFESGGEVFEYVPCLNDQDQWVSALEQLILESERKVLKV